MPDLPDNNSNIVRQVGDETVRFWSDCRSFVAFLGEVTAAGWEALCHPRKIRWRDTLFNMNRCGPDGVMITVLICFLMGVILAYQSAVQMEKYGAEVFLPVLIGCTIVRELGPLMVAMVATGRCGSAFAAEIATMKVSEELSALETMGISPFRFLVIPKMLAMLCVLPLLSILGDFIGILGGFLVGVTEFGLSVQNYLQMTQRYVTVPYFLEGIFKSFIFAWLITLAGCWCGFTTSGDSVGVGKATTRSVVISILLIVIADAIMGKIFSVLYSFGG